MTPGTDEADGARTTHQKYKPKPKTSPRRPKTTADTGAVSPSPFDDPTRRTSDVQVLVDIYANTVHADGGIATTSMRAAIGANVRRLLRDDDLDRRVLVAAVQAAAAKRAKTVDPYLGAIRAGAAGHDARQAMFARWAHTAADLDAQGGTA
jgi:hypothetical protein